MLVGRIVDRKDRKHGVADEFQHLAAMVHDRAGHGVEEVVEEGEIGCARQGLGQPGGIAKIGEPDHGVDILCHRRA